MVFDARHATGKIRVDIGNRRGVFAGSACLFRHDHIALTAGHCVPESTDAIHLEVPYLSRLQEVRQVIRHPQADIAILICDENVGASRDGVPDHAFWDRVSNWNLTEEFLAYGYPVEGPSPDRISNQPTARAFVGHLQRFFRYSSPAGYTYTAGEMSIPSPSGLSGGPVFRRGAQSMLLGIVTANIESFALTDSIEEIREGGETFRLESRRVLSYGLCLMLSTVSDWLQENIPLRDGLGWVS